MAGMFYCLVQMSMNIIYVGLQTYFQTSWFYEHLAKKRYQKQQIIFKLYPRYF